MESSVAQTVEHSFEDKRSETPGNEPAVEFSSWKPESVIEASNEDNFDDKSDLDEEQTPEKLIIESHFHNSKDFNHLHSDNDSSCSSYESLISEKGAEEVQDSLKKNRLMKYVPTSEMGIAHSKALSISLQTELWQESKTESSLVQMLRRQLESLALKEQEVERTLSKQRIENLVSKVEEEVEFEGMVEDLCLRFKAEGEFMDIERRERDWERERREVRLEEEVELLRNKVEILEEELRMAHTEKDCTLQLQTERHELIDIMQLSAGSNGGQPSPEMYADSNVDENSLTLNGGQQDLSDGGGENSARKLIEVLHQAEEKAEKDRKLLEDTFQDEQKLWIENEQLLQNQICTLEKELNCMGVTLKEKESVISVERERRRQYGLEVDKVLAFWREENTVHNSVHQRLNTVESALSKTAERLKHLTNLYPDEETEAGGLLSELLSDLEDIDSEKLEIRSPSTGQQLLEWELVEQWKLQRDLLEEERDRLQQKLVSTTEMARDNEERMARLWQEKEMNLVKQLRSLEVLVGKNGVIYKDNTISQGEKGIWECDITAYSQAWQEERAKVQLMMAEREQLMEEHTHEWAAVLNAKEQELCALKSAQKRLVSALTGSKKQLFNLKRQLARNRRGTANNSVLKLAKSSTNSDAIGGLCSDESDFDTSYSTDLSVSNEESQNANEDYYLNAQQIAGDISKEIGRLAMELRQEQGRLEREREDVRIGTQQLKDERKELETKVADALGLMEDLREQIKAKEGEMERERREMDLVLNAKEEETEHLRKLLNAKDLDIQRGVRKFKEELELIQEELEKERKERENVMDMHFSSRRKLIQEMKEKEARWEKEIEEMSQEMEELRKEINEKNQAIGSLRNDLKDFETNADEISIREDDRCSILRISQDMPNTFIKYARTGAALTKSGSTHGISFSGRRDVEWQELIGKITGFDKQIAEAMMAIQSLKEELNAKEKELQRARLERDSERKAAWVHERVETKDLEEHSRILDGDEDWGEREHLLVRNNEDLIKLLEVERADTADAMSILQGAVRELQWALKHSKGKDTISSLELNREAQRFALKGELVKVHTSHLEELDGYILDLKLKVEEAEKRARTAEIALTVNAVKEAARNTGTVSALVKVGNDWVDKSQLRGRDESSPASGTRRGWGGGGIGFEAQSPARRLLKTGGQGSGIPGPDFKDARLLSAGTRESAQLWDVGASSPGLDVSSNSSSSGWMTLRGGTDDSLLMQDSFQQAPLTLAVSTPPPRSQRRWLVDALWLENVRKEQASLKQQLDWERQRVSALKQVEVENGWLEATIIQTLEQKKDSDTRVLKLEQKVAFLESMINKKGGREKSPVSSSFFNGTRV